MSARIHPTAIVDAGAVLGADVEVGPYCIVEGEVRLGDRVRLLAHVHVASHVEIGPDTEVHSFAALGGPPQDLSYKGEPTRLVIGARNVIREHATMHRGTVRGKSVTRVGDDGFFMAQSHVAHDCVVENRVILSHAATLGGHAHVEEGAILGGLAAIHQRGRVGRAAMVGGLAAVVDDVPPFTLCAGNPARLKGLNLVGLKRRGHDKASLRRIVSGYRALFEGAAPFAERLAVAESAYADVPEIAAMLAFIKVDAARPIMMAR